MATKDEKLRLSALVVLENVAMTCRQNVLELAAGKSDEFSAGLRMAYLDALSVLVEEAELHGVPLADIGLAGYDPYRDPTLLRRPESPAPATPQG